MKRVVSIVICVLMLVMLCSCGGGKDNTVANTDWQLTGVNLGGIEVNGAEQLAEYGIEGSIIFSADQFMLTLVGDQIGSYTQKGDILTLTGSDGKLMFGVLEGDSLVIEDDDVGTLCFARQ